MISKPEKYPVERKKGTKTVTEKLHTISTVTYNGSKIYLVRRKFATHVFGFSFEEKKKTVGTIINDIKAALNRMSVCFWIIQEI